MKKFLIITLVVGVGVGFVVSQAGALGVGERVQTVGNLSVRSTPSTAGNLLGVQQTGNLGTIVEGSVQSGGYAWWNVNYDVAPDGWSAGNWLTSVGGGSSTSTSQGCDYDGNGNYDVFDVNALVAYVFRGGPYPNGNADVNLDGAADVFDVVDFVNYVFRAGPFPAGCEIANQAPVIQSFTGPTSLIEDTYGTWNALASDPDGDRLTYIINWGDNNSTSTTVISNVTSSYWITASHTYPNPGTYLITLTVQDPSLAADYANTSVSVYPTSTLAITGLNWPSTLQVGATGTWSVFATGSYSSNPLVYEFYWGDGTGVSTTAWGGTWVNRTHFYSQPGYYSSAGVTVRDDLGASDFEFTPVTVLATITPPTPNPPPVLTSFTWPPSLSIGQVGTWYASASDTEGGSLTYHFDLGNATKTASGLSGQTVAVTNSYSQPGSYLTNVYAKDAMGAQSSLLWGNVWVSSSTSSSTAPFAPTSPIYQTTPTKQLTPASVYDSLQQQIDLIYQQLQLIRTQL